MPLPVPSRRAESVRRTSLALEELITHLDYTQSTPNILSWMPNSRLRRLSIEAHGTDIFNIIKQIVTDHQETLQEIVFTSAWESTRSDYHFGDKFNAAWEGWFAITDLVLACKSPTFYHPSSGLRQTYLSYDLFAARTWYRTRWGQRLERVRLEAPPLHSMGLECLQEPTLANLRILILYPALPGQTGARYPQPLESFEEGRLASRIAQQAPTSLRYLSVGRDAFWIEPNGEPRIRYYAEALAGKRAEIMSWLTEEDRAFIDPDTWFNVRRKHDYVPPDSASGFPPDDSILNEWNFIIARRVQKTSVDAARMPSATYSTFGLDYRGTPTGSS